MRKTIHIAGILILLVCLEVVWGEEEAKAEETEASGQEEGKSDDHPAEGNSAPESNIAAADGDGATTAKLGRMGNSIIPVIVAAGAALL
ncbi:unnamed protein product [Cylicocyclus nassatus]|uniref:Uncharacterized protein n=1 Tax=Cylicocyclus nassatus TaxID=53992 RepID=A0AA36GPR8_CYLNA|nr:unnamed protein product [Cylicocyclus nassatus]